MTINIVISSNYNPYTLYNYIKTFLRDLRRQFFFRSIDLNEINFNSCNEK